jgi:[glutamine synthetase] adenylyltransferase / [glutamine synthetase]-adenylyl-L-tyrosine phosphorylase
MATGAGISEAFVARITETPVARTDDRVAAALAVLRDRARAAPELATLANVLDKPHVADLIAGIFAGSPYLSGLIERDLPRLQRILAAAPEARLDELKAELARALNEAPVREGAMRALRRFKAEAALLTALADLAGVWTEMDVTAALTACADAAVSGAVDFLFREAAARGEWLGKSADGTPAPLGFVVLAMGKGGAAELNYSSDVDLIVFYDLDRIALAPGSGRRRRSVRKT